MDLIRVMLVDDQSIVREALRLLLEEEPGIKVVAEATDGESAIALACDVLPDVIVMDIRMPGLNGIDATRQIMASDHRMNVIAFSAEDDPVTRQAMRAAGARAYLTKDVSFDTLRATIHTLMAQPGGSVGRLPARAGTARRGQEAGPLGDQQMPPVKAWARIFRSTTCSPCFFHGL